MSPAAGAILVDKVLGSIQGAVARGRVKLLPGENADEVVQDTLHTAAKMIHAAEVAGKPYKASTIAWYAIQQAKSRRSTSASRTDVMAAGTILSGRSSLLYLDTPVTIGDEIADDVEHTFHDIMADSNAADPAVEAGQHVDWDTALVAMDSRMRGVVEGTASGVGTSELAAKFKISAPRVCQVREAAGEKIAEVWGGNPVADAARETAWRRHVRAHQERRLCRAERAG